MQSEVVMSPMFNGSDAFFEKIRQLGSEISEGIVNLSNGKRWLVDVELERLKGVAQQETAPEATYNLLLFRKYADIANQIKEDHEELQTRGASFPIILPEAGNDERLLKGLDAMRSNLFWLRVAAALLSFISFVVMSTVPHVENARFVPFDYFTYSSYCSTYYLSGYFNMRPYQFVIVTGVLIYLQTLVTSLYYLLPVDDANQKYIPGLKSCVAGCVGAPDEAELLLTRVADWFRPLLRVIEFCADLTLVLLSAVAFLVAAVALEAPTSFETADPAAGYEYGQPQPPQFTYYTLPAYYLTFSSAQACTEDEDPTPKIRASLAMLFLAMCVMLLCLHVSWRNARKEITHRAAPPGLTDMGRRGIHTGEGRERFLAAPLRTSSEHGSSGEEEEVGEGVEDYDEEVAITFNRPVTVVAAAAATAAVGPTVTTRSNNGASSSYRSPERRQYSAHEWSDGEGERKHDDAAATGGVRRPATLSASPAYPPSKRLPGPDAPNTPASAAATATAATGTSTGVAATTASPPPAVPSAQASSSVEGSVRGSVRGSGAGSVGGSGRGAALMQRSEANQFARRVAEASLRQQQVQVHLQESEEDLELGPAAGSPGTGAAAGSGDGAAVDRRVAVIVGSGSVESEDAVEDVDL